MKICTKCGEGKEEGEFSREEATKDGLGRWCKICCAEYDRKWRKENIDKLKESRRKEYKKNRKQRIKASEDWREENPFQIPLMSSRVAARKYGWTPCDATVKELKNAFTGKCFICGISENKCTKKLHMDHSHSNGNFRGWLCHKCNNGLGNFDDSPQLLEIAAAYLRASIRKNSA